MDNPHPSHHTANATPGNGGSWATTRELEMSSPAHPATMPLALGVQVILAVLGLVMLAFSTATALILLAAAVVALPFTWHGWNWKVKYPKARLLTAKKMQGLAAGTWLVRPGSKYAVVVKEIPVGARSNPTIADGLTREELAIIAPVYSFAQAPKNSRAS